MEYFQALADTMHFGRAAEIVGVTQPALSAQIAEMEERLNCRLFERDRRVVRLTEEARLLRPRIARILEELRDIEAIARRGRQAMQGRFRLGIIPTIAPYMLPEALPAIRQRFPELQLELREAMTTTLIDDALNGRLDGFIAAEPLETPALASEKLFEDRFFLAVPAADPSFTSHPVPPESLALDRLMLLEEGHCLREQALAVCGHVKPVAMASYGATSLTTLLQMVSHGLGITLVPEMALEATSTMRDLKLVPFAEPAPARTICLAWRRNSPRGDECRALARAVREIATPGSTDAPSDAAKQMEPQP